MRSPTSKAELAYTICGPAEVLTESGDDVLVRQSDGEAVLEGLVPRNDVRPRRTQARCSGPALVRTTSFGITNHKSVRASRLRLLDRGRSRLYEGPVPPAGLVSVGRIEARALDRLADNRATIYWLYLDQHGAARCLDWRVERVAGAADGGALVKRFPEANGDIVITRFFLHWGRGPDAHVGITGPHSEVVAPAGRTPESGGVSFSGGAGFRLVGASEGVITLLRNPPGLDPVVAYSPQDVDRWYLDRAACEAIATTPGHLWRAGFGPPGPGL